MPKLHLRDALPWFVPGLVLVVGAFVAAIVAPESDDERAPSWLLAAFFWGVVLPGALLAVKGILVVLRDLTRPQALKLAGLTVVTGIAAVILHNVVSALFNVEEGFFFILALFVAPPVFVAALVRVALPGQAATRAP